MPLPQILRSRAQFAIPLLQRSIRIQAPSIASRSRYFITTLPRAQELETPAIEPDTNVPVQNEEPQQPPPTTPSLTTGPIKGPPIRKLISGKNIPETIVPIIRYWIPRTTQTKGLPIRRVVDNMTETIPPKIEEKAFRTIPIDKLMGLFHGPQIVLRYAVVVRKFFLRDGDDPPGMNIFFIGQAGLKDEWKFIAESNGSEPTPIMKRLGITSVWDDSSRYMIMNPGVYDPNLRLKIEEIIPETESISKIERFYPRRIAHNIDTIKRTPSNSKALIENSLGQFQVFERIDAIGMVIKQLNHVIKEYEQTFKLTHEFIFHPPGSSNRSRLSKSVTNSLNKATAVATSILNIPPAQTTLTGEENESTIENELTNFIKNLDIAIKYMQMLIALAEGGKPNELVEVSRKITRMNRSISYNIRSLLETPTKQYVESMTRQGLRWQLRVDAFDVVVKQIGRNIRGLVVSLRAMGYKPLEREPQQEKPPQSKLPKKITPRIHFSHNLSKIRKLYLNPSPSHTSVLASPSDPFVPSDSPYFARPGVGGDRREYSTEASMPRFHRSRHLSRDPHRDGRFGGEKPGNYTPAKFRPPPVAPGTSVREKLAEKEKERLKAMEGLGYSLLTKDHKDGSAGVQTEVDNEPLQNVSAWEGGIDFIGLTDESGVEPLRKGDLCELRGGSSPGLGVFLRPSLSGEPTSDFLTMSGEITMHQAARISFAIPSFIPEESVIKLTEQYDRIAKASGLEGRNRNQVVLPRQFIASLLDKVRSFANEANSLFAHRRADFDELYKKLAMEDEESTVTLFEAAEEIFGDSPGDTHLYATHLALMGDGVRYMADKAAHRATSTFKVRSVADVSMIEFVADRIRTVTKQQERTSGKQAKEQKEQLSAFGSFLSKVRYLIDTSREYKKEDLEVERQKKQRGPLVQRLDMKNMAWTKDDRRYIDYIKASILRAGTQSVPMSGLFPLLLRAVERYDGELDALTAYQFLTEIGAWSPWENLALRQPSSISFPGYGTSRVTDEDKKLVDKIDTPEAVEGMGLKDILKDIRKDWGQMEVYCIDDASAHEIDDGISLERVSDTENWVHVHIANPTAFLPQSHWLSDVAFRRKQSLYLPEVVFPMLPSSLTGAIGMGPNREAMSISAKINMEGEVLDFNVQAGFVRNVKRFTYQAVAEAIGYPETKPLTLQVGEFPKPAYKNPKANFPEKQITDLKTLLEIALACRKRRVKDGMMVVNSPKYDVEVYDGLQSPIHPVDSPFPNLYRGHPSIRIIVDSNAQNSSISSQFLVSELMQLANNAVAKFCGKNNIAAPFRVQEYDYERKDVVDAYKKYLLPSRDAFGCTAFETGLRYMMLIGPTRLSASSKPHRLMGLEEGYIRATSPLRRYSDMIVHWQIQSYLLGKSPRTHKQLSSIIPEMDRGERLGQYTAKDSRRFWAAVMVARMLELGNPKLPEGLTFMVMEKAPFPSMSTGLVAEIGMAGKVMYRSKAEEMATTVGDILNVVPLAAKPGEKFVWFESRGIARRGADMEKALLESQ